MLGRGGESGVPGAQDVFGRKPSGGGDGLVFRGRQAPSARTLPNGVFALLADRGFRPHIVAFR
jgi:hypothetical protein